MEMLILLIWEELHPLLPAVIKGGGVPAVVCVLEAVLFNKGQFSRRGSANSEGSKAGLKTLSKGLSKTAHGGWQQNLASLMVGTLLGGWKASDLKVRYAWA